MFGDRFKHFMYITLEEAVDKILYYLDNYDSGTVDSIISVVYSHHDYRKVWQRIFDELGVKPGDAELVVIGSKTPKSILDFWRF